MFALFTIFNAHNVYKQKFVGMLVPFGASAGAGSFNGWNLPNFAVVRKWCTSGVTIPDLLLGDVEVRRLVHLKILGDYGSKGENAKTLTKQKERNWPDQAFRPAIYQVGPGYTDKISNNVNPQTWLSLINPCSKDNIISKKQDQNVYGL